MAGRRSKVTDSSEAADRRSRERTFRRAWISLIRGEHHADMIMRVLHVESAAWRLGLLRRQASALSPYDLARLASLEADLARVETLARRGYSYEVAASWMLENGVGPTADPLDAAFTEAGLAAVRASRTLRQ